MDWAQWIIVGMTILMPVLLGIFAHTGRHAILGSALVGVLGATMILGYALYYLGAGGSAPRQTLSALLLIGTGATISGSLGWVAHRLATLFRTGSPRVARQKALYFILSLVFQIAALVVVVDALGLVAMVDFAQETPIYMYYEWKAHLYPYVALALLIVFAWSFRYARPPNVEYTSTPRMVLFRVAPIMAITFLFLPIVMAWVEFGLSITLLDCPPIIIDDPRLGYTKMIDYTLFVLESLVRGAVLDIGFHFNISTCAPHRASFLASSLGLVLKLAPLMMVAWLALRSYRLRIQFARLKT
jgi:hypothetical protein